MQPLVTSQVRANTSPSLSKVPVFRLMGPREAQAGFPSPALQMTRQPFQNAGLHHTGRFLTVGWKPGSERQLL